MALPVGAAVLAMTVAMAVVVAGCSDGSAARSDDPSSGAGTATSRAADRPDPRPTTPAAGAGEPVGPAPNPTGATTTASPSTLSPTAAFASPSPDPLVEALTGELAGLAPDGPRPLSAPEARCVATGMVARLGADVLARLGTSPGGGRADVAALAPAERQAYAEAVVGCLDLRRLLVDRLVRTLDLPEPELTCLADALAGDGTMGAILRRAAADGSDPQLASPQLVGPVTDALRRCLTPDELGRLDLRR